MTATRALRERQLYRPGRPAQSIWLQVFRLDAMTASLHIRSRTGIAEWGDAVQRQFSAPDDASIDARLQQEESRWLAEGYQAEGLALPACQSTAQASPAAIARLTALLDANQWRLLSPSRRARVAWRLGELRAHDAAPSLAELLGSGDNLLDYCLVWALGRCGTQAQAGALIKLAQQDSQRKGERGEALTRLLRLAWLELASESSRQQYLDSLVEDWPAALRKAWQEGDEASITAAVADPASFQRLGFGEWLEHVDQIARFDPLARKRLHTILAEVKVEAGVFRALRHLYKAAEMRGDGATWALLALRFEQTPGTFGDRNSYRYIRRKWQSVRDELTRADSSLAWSRATRGYFLRRSWRSLRRLGIANSPEFIDMAFATLMRFDEATTAAPSIEQLNHYDYQARMWRQSQRHHPAFGRSMLFNRLLHRPGGALRSNTNGTCWWSEAPLPARQTREEAFPALWNERPDLLVRLLLEARAEAIHAFAALALKDCQPYLAQLDEAVWLRLLNSAYACTAEFALAQIRSRIEAITDTSARTPWLVLLVGSRHQAVWQAALDWISEDPARYATDARLVVAMLTAHHKAVRQQARLLCQASLTHTEIAEATVAQLLNWLEALDELSDAATAPAADVRWAIANPLRPYAAVVEHARLLALLASPSAAAQVTAVEWLLLHQAAVSDIPASAYKALLDSPDEAVQGAGVRLFGALPDSILLTQGALVARFCTSSVAAVREAAIPALTRLAAADPAFARELAAALADNLFRAEEADGLHAHITKLLTQTLADAARTLDTALCLRLLTARSRSAQIFGAWLLAGLPDDALGARDWSRLGRVDSLEVRQRALRVLADMLDRDANLLDEVLGVLDTRWDETREAATALLRQKIAASQWTPAQLIALCDHLNPTVQAFGRELILPRLQGDEEGKGALDYLLPLAEHPAPRMQQFVAEWLGAALPADPALLGRLRLYFVTVLSQVNRGRAAKSSTQALLRQLAAQSEACAREVVAIFERLAVTVAIADRAQYIAGLYEIRARYPELGGTLNIVAPELRKGAA